ncbi:hypothetical protein DLM75_00100 [Leptospira stimsonii]|uniref:Uncharacterized protein n=1 Tax=Leptospira stimsonii TaxID=2202203 RepID=A0A396ZF15_9LEPT|nr:hypothetical protein DLM75_00100 [Leptospira stimsonii]
MKGIFFPISGKSTIHVFKATWNVFGLNRNYSPDFIGASETDQIQNFTFGVRFLLPVDEYHRTIRSSKCIELFLLLTFITYFFIEVFK